MDSDLDEPRIDLSALDVYADRLRFERTVRALAGAAPAPPPNPQLVDLVRLGRLGLAAAAALALAAWIPAWLQEDAAAATFAAADPVLQVAEWADAGTIPASASLFQLVEVSHVR
jgi:hypothetical protein